jgi:hypothetical protein
MFSQETENSPKPKPVTLHGDIGLSLMGYSVSGISARQLPFSYILSANATLSIYKVDLPFSFVFSDKQRNYAQSFNEFGISPTWKWITVHLGYRNVTFSNYTLAGHTFLGAGLELNPGIFRFGFIYGKFQRQTPASPVFETDSLPTFKRTGFAVKLGVGNEKNFFDLVFLRIRDDSTSMHQPDTGTIRTPEQNIVAGINSKFTFFKKLVWEVEGAVSLYTNDMSANPSLDSTAAPILVNMNEFLVINQSSEYYTALRTSLKYTAKTWNLKLEYRRIDPNYRTMGAYYFSNDLENLTLSPYLTFFKRKFSISGSIGLQRDNLAGVKKATSVRTIGSVNVSCNPSSKFGVDASYSNYHINQQDGRLPLNDTAKVLQSNQNFTLTPRLIFVNTRLSHLIMLMYNLSTFTDKNEFNSGNADFNSNVAQLLYSLGIVKTRWTFSAGFTYTSLSSKLAKNSGLGGTLGVSKSFFKNKLTLNWNNALVYAEQQQQGGWVLNSNITGNYKIYRHHALKLGIFYTGNFSDPGSTVSSFNEFKGNISYVYNF